MKIVCVSDTHTQLPQVNIPDGDILIHSGDLTYRGNIQETSKELYELSKHRARFKHIILVEGNHDRLGERNPSLMNEMCKDNGITLLRGSSITIDGLLFYGDPHQPEFFSWAFNLPRGKALKNVWAKIPDNVDVLITHCPPMGILDIVRRLDKRTGMNDIEHAGCEDLYNRIQELKNLKLSVFGHLHDCGGQMVKIGETAFVNAAICTENYLPTNSPIVVQVT